ncbi:MAG: iron dicitrate transport regulator FecR [Gammaproteobacteria bacterium HGW-Gammaproteobacteria-3]|nr:MAG: iron dicitrate transport regulator FecR [Gammaproteobacteria bacterium HGW-Gammaproteobacteria-3]
MLTTAALSDAQKQAIRWQSRLSEKKCPEQVKQDFDHWLASSPENVEAFNMIQYFWDQFGHLQAVGEPELNEARHFAQTAQTRRRARNGMLGLLFAVIGLAAAQPDLALKLTSRQYQTAKGDTVSIALSDGSSIKLNTDSTIKVADILGWRKAWLANGEAWFTIHHDADKPFEVFAGQAHIVDIGTQFNVFTDASKTTVTVLEGEVILKSGNSQPLTLSANQQSSVDDLGQIAEKTGINSETIGSWRSGVLIFQNQRLHEVLQQLSRYHQAEFTVLDASVQNRLVSGRFSTTQLAETLHTLSQAMNLNIKQQQPGQFLISKAARH